MKSVIFKIKTINASTYVKIFPKDYTKMYLKKKRSMLRAQRTVKQHLGMGGNLFSNHSDYQISLVFASETKILSTVCTVEDILLYFNIMKLNQ